MNFHLNYIKYLTIQKEIMSAVRTKSIETTPLKKTLKKKVVDEKITTPVEKIKKTDTKVVLKADSAKKETVKKETIKKETTKTEDEEKKAVEKTPKKINVKPTLGHLCGLNLSVAKVRNIISNLCINNDTFVALKEMKEHRTITTAGTTEPKQAEEFTFALKGLSQETLSYLDICTLSINESKGLLFSRKITRDMNKEQTIKYNEAKRIAVTEFQTEQKSGHLFQKFDFNLTEFNTKYNSAFYEKMEDSEVSWKLLKDHELYEYCVNVVNKNKVRFNSESKIFITSFVEYIIKQLVINGTKNCINDKKKIIQPSHALDNPSADFTMFPFISGSSAYKTYISGGGMTAESEAMESEAENEVESDPEVDHDTDSEVDRKLQFKYYISELCRHVRMDLSEADGTTDIESKFNQTSVSRLFKEFCSDIVIELLQMFGNILKVEVSSRQVKTVNYNIIGALVRNAHIFHSLDVKPTVIFMQEKYNKYNSFLKTRTDKRGAAAALR